MDINYIKDYIIKKYPDTYLAENIEHNNYYEEELMEACEDFFYYEKLHWCGCGDPNTAKRTIRDFLSILNITSDAWQLDGNSMDALYKKRDEAFEKRFGVKSIYDNELLLCFAYAMDAAEFTEHGSSIGGAWIETEGKMFLWLLKHNKELDIEE